MNHFDDAIPDEPNTRLDAGLRAAFGGPPTESSSGWNESIVTTIDHALGIHSRVSLRDDADSRGPLLDPRSPEIDDSEGRIGRYQLAGEIARGGIGVVLRGRDVDLGRDVAIKMLRGQHAANGAMVQRFMEEAQITGQLQHPGILPVYELGLRAGNRPYFTMKLVKGRTLAELLRERRRPADDRPRFLNIFEHICQTLAYAHARGVVHRDLKPANIMVGAFGEVQVLDWGLAKVLTRDRRDEANADAEPESVVETVRSGEDSSQSLAGAVMGTPAYMPPEQARGDVGMLDERADVFALGAILCEILTGAPPYAGAKMDVLRKATACDLTDALARLRQCDADPILTVMAERCMAAAPNDRPHNAGVLAEEVAGFIACLEESAQEAKIAAAAAMAKAGEERRAKRLTMALAGSALVVLLLIGAGILWRGGIERDRIHAATAALNDALDRARLRLGEAKASRFGDRAPWEAALAAGDEVRQLLKQDAADDETLNRGDAFIDDLEAAHADRRLIDTTEEIVMAGATHQDAESWTWMDDAYIAAFKQAGMDVLHDSDETIAARIRASDNAVRLANSFELWAWTGDDLRYRFGVQRYDRPLRERVTPVFLADTDPYRTAVRDQMYHLQTGDIDIVVLRELAADPAFETAPATTLSWLGSMFFTAKQPDPQGGMDVFRRAALLHPDDFMLNFDYARMLDAVGHTEAAARIFTRCVGIRPNIGGTWRSLGITLRKLGDHRGSIDAMERSIELQPEHAPTYFDLWLTYIDMRDFDGAVEAFDRAMALRNDNVSAAARLAAALPEQDPATRKGQLELAIQSLTDARTAWEADAVRVKALDAWITQCEQAIAIRNKSLKNPCDDAPAAMNDKGPVE